jgi:hypothetical protein
MREKKVMKTFCLALMVASTVSNIHAVSQNDSRSDVAPAAQMEIIKRKLSASILLHGLEKTCSKLEDALSADTQEEKQKAAIGIISSILGLAGDAAAKEESDKEKNASRNVDENCSSTDQFDYISKLSMAKSIEEKNALIKQMFGSQESAHSILVEALVAFKERTNQCEFRMASTDTAKLNFVAQLITGKTPVEKNLILTQFFGSKESAKNLLSELTTALKQQTKKPRLRSEDKSNQLNLLALTAALKGEKDKSSLLTQLSGSKDEARNLLVILAEALKAKKESLGVRSAAMDMSKLGDLAQSLAGKSAAEKKALMAQSVGSKEDAKNLLTGILAAVLKGKMGNTQTRSAAMDISKLGALAQSLAGKSAAEKKALMAQSVGSKEDAKNLLTGILAAVLKGKMGNAQTRSVAMDSSKLSALAQSLAGKSAAEKKALMAQSVGSKEAAMSLLAGVLAALKNRTTGEQFRAVLPELSTVSSITQLVAGKTPAEKKEILSKLFGSKEKAQQFLLGVLFQLKEKAGGIPMKVANKFRGIDEFEETSLDSADTRDCEVSDCVIKLIAAIWNFIHEVKETASVGEYLKDQLSYLVSFVYDEIEEEIEDAKEE